MFVLEFIYELPVGGIHLHVYSNSAIASNSRRRLLGMPACDVCVGPAETKGLGGILKFSPPPSI